MFNHFRTLLLNLGNVGDATEHIPASFNSSLPLPKEMQNFYDLLFPPNSSRFYKEFLVFNYLELIASTPFNTAVTEDDSRITYDLKGKTEYFKLRRNSNPMLSNTSFPLFVHGFYHNNIAADDLSDTIEIKQVDNTSAVNVYSKTKGEFYLENETLVFTNNMSQEVYIPSTNLSFAIGGNSFTSTENKKWTFLAEAPFVFDFNSLITKLNTSFGTVDNMLNYRKEQVDETYENLWKQHPNPVYKLSGLLIAYTQRVNTLWET